MKKWGFWDKKGLRSSVTTPPVNCAALRHYRIRFLFPGPAEITSVCFFKGKMK